MGLGFFSKTETQTTGGLPGRRGCGACGLWKDCTSPKLGATGEGQKGILIIAESPSQQEDRRGELSILSNLRRELRQNGINFEKDCRKIDAVACRPPEGRDPADIEIEACRQRVLEEIKTHPPKLILLLGNAAIKSVIGNYWRRDLHGVDRWRGWAIPDRNYKAWICPTYHPEYVNRMSSDNPVVEIIWKRDLEKALACLSLDFPSYPDETTQVEILSERAAVRMLNKTGNSIPPVLFSHDYEATGLKPHAQGHRILTASFCVSCDKAYAFKIPKYECELKKVWRDIMRAENIWKAAHNAKFEDNWTNAQFGEQVKGWRWDTMLVAHILDNRPKIASLKFQYYVHFGLVGYEDDVYEYMISNEEEGGNGFNRLEELMRVDPEAVLIYNGVDSLAEHRLALMQMKLLEHPLYYKLENPF